MPSEPDAPDAAYEKSETRGRVRAAILALPAREQKVISLYYYKEATMKEIGAAIGVNESRVSQLHARAIKRLRESLGQIGPKHMAAMREALVDLASTRPAIVKVALPKRANGVGRPAQVLAYSNRKARPTSGAQVKPAALRPRVREAIALAR